jgi:multiple sugar transport system permease protein
LIIAIAVPGGILSAVTVSYGFARFRFKGNNFWFMVMLGTMMLPYQVTLIPQYLLYHQLGWVNTYIPLTLPSWFGGGAFAIFLLRQFMMTLPRDLDEAALIDGASFVRIFWNILIPLCKPVLATLAVISIIGRWNDFLGPLIYLRSIEKFTIAVGLNAFRFMPDSAGEPMQHLLMAASVMSTAPLIVLFFSAQQYFVQGIALTGIKG